MMEDKPYKVFVPGIREKVLSYNVPEWIDPAGLAGKRVLVPLLRKQVVGLAISPDIPHDFKMRSIVDVVDREPLLNSTMLHLVFWMRRFYAADFSEVLSTILPKGLLKTPQARISFTGSEMEGFWPPEVLYNTGLLKLCRMLAAERKLSFQALKSKRRSGRIWSDLAELESMGLVQIKMGSAGDLRKMTSDEWLILTDEGAGADIPPRHKAKIRVISFLQEHQGEAPWKWVSQQTSCTRKTIESMTVSGWIRSEYRTKKLQAQSFDPRERSVEFPLTDEQKKIILSISDSLAEPTFAGFLLTGIPGTGKTRVYLEAVKSCLAEGKRAIILVPEIALTPQVIARIENQVGIQTAVAHSSLPSGQRLSYWRAMRDGEYPVVVGSRSAIFSPMENVGLIVMDEEHEDSFKQEDPSPRYHTRDIALQRCRKAGATLLLVSATPSLECHQLVDSGEMQKLTLTERFGAGWPEIELIDRRGSRSTESRYITPQLDMQIRSRIDSGEGVILLVTRRGFAPILVCRDCGGKIECPNCSLTLTYHRVGSPRLKCHQCGYSTNPPDTCPACHSDNLRILGAGTQRIEEELAARYPELHPIRMDSDSTSGRKHRAILRQFHDQVNSILVGTQMVAKGHDFSNVTLVGIVNADSGLYLPDFRAGERTYRLLVQAAGRAGRGNKPGTVLIQTMAPDHLVFRAVLENDVQTFLDNELSIRRNFGYPPFATMCLLSFASAEEQDARKDSEQAIDILHSLKHSCIITGPVQALIPKLKRRFRWRVLLRTLKQEDPEGEHLMEVVSKVRTELTLSKGVSLRINRDPLEII